jgi:glycerophosphoryl diester phosphodiesterase
MRDAPVAHVTPDGHRVALKWHRARRQAGDMAFSPARVAEGLAAGASVEVDINPLACGDWAVIHDATLDRETTGQGPVAGMTAADLSALRLRGAGGAVSEVPVGTLSRLAQEAAVGAIGAGSRLQLDLKVDADALTAANVAGFAAAVAPVAGHLILSGGDAGAVLRLARAAGIAVGYDPCHDGASVDLARTGRFDEFADGALAAMPAAVMIYLDRHLVALAASRGADLIAPFRAAGRQVDVYTFRDAGAAEVAAARAAIAQRADQITTDDPAGMLRALSGA